MANSSVASKEERERERKRGLRWAGGWEKRIQEVEGETVDEKRRET